MVCAVWSEDQWPAVDAVVACEEAEAILKASGGTAHAKGKVSPTDVSVGKPRKGIKAKKVKSDKLSADNLIYDPTDAYFVLSQTSIPKQVLSGPAPKICSTRIQGLPSLWRSMSDYIWHAIQLQSGYWWWYL